MFTSILSLLEEHMTHEVLTMSTLSDEIPPSILFFTWLHSIVTVFTLSSTLALCLYSPHSPSIKSLP